MEGQNYCEWLEFEEVYALRNLFQEKFTYMKRCKLCVAARSRAQINLLDNVQQGTGMQEQR